MNNKVTKVGIGILVEKNEKLLFIKRKGSHGFGTWAPPGGHLDFGEKPEDAAYRECLEETGVECKDIEFITYTNDLFKETNKHYITLWFKAKWYKGEGIINSPNEVLEVKWLTLDEIPKPYFLSLENFLTYMPEGIPLERTKG